MKKLLLLLIVITITSISIFGQTIPKQISYQGVLRLANGNIVGDGNYQLTFKIYNSLTGGTALWTEAQTVMVTNGVFSPHLGSITPITGVAFNRDHYLGISIAAEPELSPRTKLTPTPYSFMAMDIMNNTVNSEKIVNLSITGTDIANSTIGPEKLNFTPGSGTIGGSGTANYIPKFTANTTLGNSAIYQTGTTPHNVGIGTTAPTAQLHVLNIGTNNTYGRIATTIDGVNAYTNVSGGYAIYGVKGASASRAGYFSGAVHVAGALSKSSGSFKIDHPLDPANKYLYHSFVESPDMMNIYNGNIVTDGSGYATITLPEWFEALNKDFRYQLTVIGDFAQAIIAQKVQNNQFAIRTDKPNVEVSWQVTGIRKDAWAEKNRIPVEESKKGHEVGRYIHPEVYGLPETLSIEYERNKLELEKPSK